jgi:cob(I)alamin adenosyltransferase
VVYLNRIYTKTGDAGTTALGDGSRVPKSDQRIAAIATVDETNSQIGVVVAYGPLVEPEVLEVLKKIQNDLFDVGADLCIPGPDADREPLRVKEGQVTYLERQIDIFNFPLDPLTSFVLPTGTYAAAQLHVARAVARRAEREVWKAFETIDKEVNPLTAKYLNRLSDLLFVLARYSNRQLGDSLWVPGRNQ